MIKLCYKFNKNVQESKFNYFKVNQKLRKQKSVKILIKKIRLKNNYIKFIELDVKFRKKFNGL